MKKFLFGLMVMMMSCLSVTAFASGEIYPTVTGLVVDCTGMGLQRSLSPHLLDENGRVVYGILKQGVPEFEERLKLGMVMYTHGLSNANKYAGTNPLVVKAQRVERNQWDVVISNSDAQAVAAAAKDSDFDENYRVVFVQ